MFDNFIKNIKDMMKPPVVAVPVVPPKAPGGQMKTTNITAHFTWKEALWLPSWTRAGGDIDGLTEEIKGNLIKLFTKMELVKTILGGRAVVVHCAWRPTKYNDLVKGAKNSAHLYGMAVDFHVEGMTCDEVRAKLLPHLASLGLRMEDLPGSLWVHLDIRSTTGARFFKP